MKETRCRCFKISDRINFAPSGGAGRGRDFLRLSNADVENILKYSCEEKEIYIFRFGCVSFTNFSDDEIRTALVQIKSIFGAGDYSESYIYTENIRAGFGEPENLPDGPELFFGEKQIRSFMRAAPFVLARSIELSVLEKELVELVDRSENIIGNIAKGKYRFFMRGGTAAVKEIIRFNFGVLRGSVALDEARGLSGSKTKSLFLLLSEYFELDVRQKAFMTKLDSVKRLTHKYRESSYGASMLVYYRLELIMLILFPIGYYLSANPAYVQLVRNFVSGFIK